MREESILNCKIGRLSLVETAHFVKLQYVYRYKHCAVEGAENLLQIPRTFPHRQFNFTHQPIYTTMKIVTYKKNIFSFVIYRLSS